MMINQLVLTKIDMNLNEKLKTTLASVLGINASEVNEFTSSDNLPGWDSLAQMNLIVALEEEFDICFYEAESVLLKDYPSLLSSIENKLKERDSL